MVADLLDHCEYVKDLMEYMKFLYLGKGNIVSIGALGHWIDIVFHLYYPNDHLVYYFVF